MKDQRKFKTKKEEEKFIKEVKEGKVEGSFVLPRNASHKERIKFKLCEDFLLYLKEHDMSQKELADFLGIDKARVSDIIHYRTKDYTLDRLVDWHEKLFPDADSIKIA